MSNFQIFNDAEIASFRTGGMILRQCLEMLRPQVKEGIRMIDLDRLAEEFIRDHGGLPAFKGYHDFPATLCTSVNEECVHGIPGERVLKNGDIVSLDCGVIYDDLYTDACISVGVGHISREAQNLLSVTADALDQAVQVLKPGVRVGDLSSAIQKVVERAGYVPVRSLTGHGLGHTLHQFPDIPNFGRAGTGPVFPVHTVVAVEPIVSISARDVRGMNDGWTLVTEDGSLSAHFEHTLLTTENGCEIIA
ncbi:MAG TPA: type I methionyl aminopeptidase [Candidatus Peribacteraceae bacterium]|nr:type I methionyl aminopeptidase [Candidatus Peribacteraceae bacterium]